jgi:hypothetical protein
MEWMSRHYKTISSRIFAVCVLRPAVRMYWEVEAEGLKYFGNEDRKWHLAAPIFGYSEPIMLGASLINTPGPSGREVLVS